MALLEVLGVKVRFGGNVAVDDVSLAANAGETTGLIGPNGAGKTTLFNVITGLQSPTAGRVLFDGADVVGMAPYKRARLGLARTFQRLELFGLLTVRQNIEVAADIARRWVEGNESPADTAAGLMARIGLESVADVRADALPTGQARLVELGRALATRPKILLLDEPASGQDERETAHFADLLTELAAAGMAVVLVEHDVHLVMAVCQQIHVLDFGRLAASGNPDEIRANQAVLTAYLGASWGTA
jgi:branched-chain amino acid transport system ATP-binding protein